MLTNENWVAIEIKTGKAIGEFTDPKLKENLNTDKYTAVPILEHLQSLTKQTKE